MAFSTRFCALALSFCIFACPALGAAFPAGFGTVSGRATAVCVLTAPGAPAPPSYKNDGYEQTVTSGPNSMRVTVAIDPSPLKVRTPFHPGRLPANLGLPSEFSAALDASLARCQRADEAVDAVFLTVHRNLRYVQRTEFEETPAEILKRREASCVGMTRLSATILRALGLACREVVGLRVPIREGPVVLEGGILHAWLEVAYPGGPTVFCDPSRSSGWVSETYIVLRIGGGLEPGALAAFLGGVILCESHKDRVFYEPEPHATSVLWRRPSSAAYTGTLLTGKVLGPLDSAVSGSVRLEGAGGTVSMDLWEGNFFFRDLAPGEYLLIATPLNAPPQRTLIRLNPVDRKTVLFYSPSGDAMRPGAKP
jgi:hypothetical protein